MKTETVTISRKEYERLKRLEKIHFELLDQFKRSLDDVKKVHRVVLAANDTR